jgi:hypothetical protein
MPAGAGIFKAPPSPQATLESSKLGRPAMVNLATEFLAVAFQVAFFVLVFGLGLAGYAWLVTP